MTDVSLLPGESKEEQPASSRGSSQKESVEIMGRIIGDFRKITEAVRQYETRVREAGSRSSPEKWIQIRDRIDVINNELTAMDSSIRVLDQSTKLDDPSQMFDLLDVIELMQYNILNNISDISDPAVLFLAGKSVSESHGRELLAKLSEVQTRKAEADSDIRVLENTLIQSHELFPFDEIVKAYKSSNARGALSSSLLVSHIKAHVSQTGAQVIPLLNELKESALGGGEKKGEELAGTHNTLHPIQEMELMFGSSSSVLQELFTKKFTKTKSQSLPKLGDCVDLSIGKSSPVVTYDMSPFLKTPAVATSVTGLNFKLVQHLKTIKFDQKTAQNESAQDELKQTKCVDSTVVSHCVRGPQLQFLGTLESIREVSPIPYLAACDTPQTWDPRPQKYLRMYHDMCFRAANFDQKTIEEKSQRLLRSWRESSQSSHSEHDMTVPSEVLVRELT